jgi:O-antigen/teichoic acid export membrane protein
VILRNAKLILFTDLGITLFSVVTSLVGARALGPAGRGDLLLITLWPIVIAMLIEVGLPNAYRYWMAKDPSRVSALFTNAIIYTLALGAISFVVGDILIPRLIGQRTDEVMLLVRVYMINIPGVVLLSLMRGLLEGTLRMVGRRALHLFRRASHGLCHSLVCRSSDGGDGDVHDDCGPGCCDDPRDCRCPA